MSGKITAKHLRWNYRQEKTFQVEGDRGSIQRMLLVCLQEYVELVENLDLTIGPLDQKSAPFSPALTFEPRSERFDSLEQALLADPQAAKLLDTKKIAFFENRILFPVSQIVFDDLLSPIDLLDLRSNYDSIEDAKLLLTLFFTSTSERINSLTDSLEKGEWGEAYRLAHSIKGGALSIGAHEVARVAKEIELSVKTATHYNYENAIESLGKSFLKAKIYWEKLKQKELQ